MAEPIVKDRSLDLIFPLLRHGYPCLMRRRQALGVDLFATRLRLRPVLCLAGPEAAALFYDPEKFIRQGAMPKRVQKTLVGSGGVQMLDGAQHAQRKSMFMSFMGPESLARLRQLLAESWQAEIDASHGEIRLFDLAQRALFHAACRWAHMPLPPQEITRHARDMGAMVNAFGGVGPRHRRGRWARRRSEAWAGRVIRDLRRGALCVPGDSILAAIASHHRSSDPMLSERVAAVELLNILRPITAIATYLCFGALALHDHPKWRTPLAEESEASEWFVQEVRRFYPFTPMVGACVRKTFTWRNHVFPEGRLVLLDIYGMSQDPALWDGPERFEPERFQAMQPDAFGFIPQGGGGYITGHRCAGERLTIDLMRVALGLLTRSAMEYVPGQDLHVSLRRVPTFPHSGVLLRRAA